MINQQAFRLFQFCDSQVPTGAFSHSFGLETYIQRDEVHDEHTFTNWLTLFMNEQLSYSDGLTMRLIYEALEQENTNQIIKLDNLLYVQSLPRETRQGSKQMGNRMVKLANSLYSSDWLQWYQTQMEQKSVHLHPAICFTMLGHYLNVDIATIIDYYLYQNVASLTQNAVRAIPLGQTAGQKIINDMIPNITQVRDNILQLDESQLGITAPGIELNQMEHEKVNVRIFIS